MHYMMLYLRNHAINKATQGWEPGGLSFTPTFAMDLAHDCASHFSSPSMHMVRGTQISGTWLNFPMKFKTVAV